MKRLLKWFGILLLVLLVPLALVLGAAFFLGGTEQGFNLAAREAAKRVDGLELGEFRGSLKGGIATDALSFENDALKVEARGVDTAWRLGCLARREFCLDRAVVEELDVSTFASDAPPPARAGDIALPDIRLPIGVTAKEVRVNTLRFQPPGDAPAQVLENVRLTARTEGDRVILENVSGDYGTYSATLSGELSPEGDYPLDLALALVLRDVVPEGMQGAGGTRDVRADVTLGDSAAHLDVTADVSGAVEARLEGNVEPLKGTLPATLALTAPAVGWPLDTMAEAKATDLRVTLDGTLEDYALGVTTTLGGEQLPTSTVDVSGHVNTERVALADIGIGTLGGTIGGSASLSWVDGLDWLASLDLANLDPGEELESLEGKLGGQVRASGAVSDGDWTLDVKDTRLRGTLQGYPFSLDATLAKDADGTFRIDALRLDNGNNRVVAKGTVERAWNIDATVRLPELENLAPGLSGGFSADLALSGPLAEPSLALKASAPRVALNDTVVEGLSLEADVARAALAPSSLRLTVDEVQSAGQSVVNTRLSLEGTRAEHRLSLFADGPEATSIDLEASGALGKTFDWLGRLDAATIEVPANVLRLRAPTALGWNNAAGRFSIDPHCWVSEGTELCLENKVTAPGDGSAVVSLDRYPLERLNPFLPAETTLAGALGADATLRWGKGQPGGFAARASLAIDNGGASVLDANEEPVSFTYDRLTLDADIDPSDIRANLAVSSQAMGEAKVTLQLDPTGEAKPIEGRVDLDGFRLDVVKAFVPDLDRISGTVSANGDLSGTLADPRFDGDIVLDAPIVRAQALPLPITGGRVTARVRGKRASVDGALRSDAGRIVIDGSANWQRLEAWRADVTLSGTDLALRSEPLTDSRVNHEITINARPGSIRVGGDVDVPYATIRVAELPQGAATLSDDIVVVEDVPETPPEEVGRVDPPGALELRVDVDVTLGDEVSLAAYGLTANLTGDMSVALRSPNPVQLGGEIRVVDGVYKQYGQNLEATGQIIFVGPVERTQLDIRAIRRIENEDPERIAGLAIGGDVTAPEITLFTEPADKSEEAILSYIVLGRDIGEASDQEANLLATAALALTLRGGRSIGGGIASALGIEDFALETRGQGNDTEVVVSGRLSDRLLLRYGQSVFDSGAQTLYLRYDLTKKLYLEAAQGITQAVDLFYKFSF